MLAKIELDHARHIAIHRLVVGNAVAERPLEGRSGWGGGRLRNRWTGRSTRGGCLALLAALALGLSGCLVSQFPIIAPGEAAFPLADRVSAERFKPGENNRLGARRQRERLSRRRRLRRHSRERRRDGAHAQAHRAEHLHRATKGRKATISTACWCSRATRSTSTLLRDAQGIS